LIEIYIRLTKKGYYESTYIVEEDFELPSLNPHRQTGQWRYFQDWLEALCKGQNYLEAITIINLLQFLIGAETVKGICLQLLENIPEQHPDLYYLVCKIRLNTSLSRSLSGYGHLEEAKSYAEAALGLLDQYSSQCKSKISTLTAELWRAQTTVPNQEFLHHVRSGSRSPDEKGSHHFEAPRLIAEAKLAQVKAYDADYSVADTRLKYNDIASLCNENRIWGLEDSCLTSICQSYAQEANLQEMNRLLPRLEHLEAVLQQDMASLLQTRCGFWRAGEHVANTSLLQWLINFERRFPLPDNFGKQESHADPDQWDLPAVRQRAAIIEYHIYRSTKLLEPSRKALAIANKLLLFTPQRRNLSGAQGEDWYLEWCPPASSTSISTLEVLAKRFQLSFGGSVLDERKEIMLYRICHLEEPESIPTALRTSFLSNLLANADSNSIETWLYTTPVNQDEFRRRITALEMWFSSEDTYDPDASKLLIAQLLEKRILKDYDEGDPFENLYRRTLDFVNHANNIQSISVRRYLRRPIVQAMQVAPDIELQDAVLPRFSFLREKYLQILSTYVEYGISGDHALVATIHTKLAEVEFRSCERAQGLSAFREHIEIATKYFDDLRAEWAIFIPSTAIQAKGPGAYANLTTQDRPLAPSVSILTERYFALAQEDQAAKQDIAKEIWNLVQKEKNRALNDMLNLTNKIPRQLSERIHGDPELFHHYEQWKGKLKYLAELRKTSIQGTVDPVKMDDARREVQHLEKAMLQHEALAQVITIHRGAIATADEIKSSIRTIASEEVLLVDWFTTNKRGPTRKQDIPNKLYLIAFAVNSDPEAAIDVFELEQGIGPKTKAWVAKYLESTRPEEELMNKEAYPHLQELKGLIAPLSQVLKPGQRLVFSPCTTWDVHRIPLHALELPFATVDSKHTGAPMEMQDKSKMNIFLHHKVTYAHSFSLLHSCIISRQAWKSRQTPLVLQASINNTQCADLRTPKWGGKQQAIPKSIETLAQRTDTPSSVLEDIATSTASLSYFLCSPAQVNDQVKRSVLLRSFSDSPFVYFMGHVSGGTRARPLEARLILTPEATNSVMGNNDDNLTSQDIVDEAIILEGAHLCVISCRGGVAEENITNEVLGLVPALFQAGARSVLAPLWEIVKEDAALWTNQLLEKWEDEEWRLTSIVNDASPTTMDMASVCQEASKEMFYVAGKENVGAWAGLVWYGFWDFPRIAVKVG
jgi:hypothetical protein